MFGNLVNKNARTALKEYGDHNGAMVDFDIVAPLENAHNPQYTAVAKLGERTFLPATASTKKDAKEYAADLALQALAQGTVLNNGNMENLSLTDEALSAKYFVFWLRFSFFSLHFPQGFSILCS